MGTLIEDYLPIGRIGSEAVHEKSLWRGQVSTLHLWWARRPLVACRAAVYGALVPVGRFRPVNGPEEKRASLGRANAAKFVERLCKYPGDPKVIAEAERHILEAHAERLTQETGQPVTVEDILAGRAPRPKVLDMFAGGGSIPLEALRLGCEAYALDLNPVAYIILLCTLVYPQKYGKVDPTARGMTGPPGPDGQPTWGGLAQEVRYWGERVLKKVKAEIGDLYPLIPDPEFKGAKVGFQAHLPAAAQAGLWQTGAEDQVPPGFLVPVAYLWTRTVQCKNPACGATVPLVRQTWLCKRKGRHVALKMIAPAGEKQVRFEVVEAAEENDLGFDPEAFSKGGNATCPFCGTVADIEYVKDEGWAGRMGYQLMAVVCNRPGKQGKIYFSADDIIEPTLNKDIIIQKTNRLCESTSITIPYEFITDLPPNSRDNSLGITIRPYGIISWRDLFTHRQLFLLLSLCKVIREVESIIINSNVPSEVKNAIVTYLGTTIDRQAENSSSLCRWNPNAQKMQGTFGRQALPMVWDFCEVNPFGGSVGDWKSIIDLQINAILGASGFFTKPGLVFRGSATLLPFEDDFFDSIVTDPPYYDNVPYADISDFFYVWLKRTVGHMYREHFVTEKTPKKKEAIADANRYGGDKKKAKLAYEDMMAKSFIEACRVLKPGMPMTVIYAHKTTLGWATLVDALRKAGFIVSEAWPLNTEMKTRLRGMESSALASNIFLVARKREGAGAGAGAYEDEVRPELEAIVRERVATLWQMGIGGADLLIAAVGAGLKAFTRFARVEYANGEEVPAEKFLAEVEGVVLETLLEKIFGVSRSGVAGVDGPSRFYVLWRYAYKTAEMDAGEAIVFTYTQHVELDGPQGLSGGSRSLVEKKKGKYRLRDFSERGDQEKLGLPGADGAPVPLIDILHRILYLMEHYPRKLAEFLEEARPDRERLRLLAQVLGGVGLAGGNGEKTEHQVTTTPAEKAALGKLLANWRHLIEQSLGEVDPKTGQQRLGF